MRKYLTWIITAAAVLAAGFAIQSQRLPSYSKPSDKTVTNSSAGIVIEEKGRCLSVLFDDGTRWSLEKGVRAQDFLYEDIDHDGENELLVLCWKRGRFGKRKPTWVKKDERKWSQHIFIYEISDTVRPKWMASDIGVNAVSIGFSDGILSITDTEGDLTKWVWISWGLEKL